VNEVDFKPRLKERRSYRCTEWWIRRERSHGWRNRQVWNKRTGTRMRSRKRERELIPETKTWSIRKERWVNFREDDGGRARVTTDKERVLRGRWTEMRLWRYGGSKPPYFRDWVPLMAVSGVENAVRPTLTNCPVKLLVVILMTLGWRVEYTPGQSALV